MADLAPVIRETQVAPGNLAIIWLGQAGWVFKEARGHIVYVDPYLSDAAERLHGFRRLMPSPIAADQVEADLVITTHDHIDHLDYDAVEVIARNPTTRFAGSTECLKKYPQLGIGPERSYLLEPWSRHAYDGFSVQAVFADHGMLAPDAVGVLLDFGGIRVYVTGDTAYRPEQMGWVADAGIDVLIPCINGAYGNMNAGEAAQLVCDVRPRVTMPQHFWMFAEHHLQPGGEPGSFVAACRELAPGTEPLLLTVGRPYLFAPAGA